MFDISQISAISGAIDAVTNIVRGIKEADFSLDKAILKFNLAEMAEKLAEAKLQLADVTNLIHEKEQKVIFLQKKLEQLASNERPVLKGGCYTFEGDAALYCTACWDMDFYKVTTSRVPSVQQHVRQCPKCKVPFSILG